MWVFLLVLLGLPSLGSGTPLTVLHLPAVPRNGSNSELRRASTSPAPPVTPTALPPHSEAPALSLNLGLNFKIKVRSQGKASAGEGGLRGATAHPGLPLPPSQAPPGSRFWPEALGGSGWLGPGLAEEQPSGPGGWAEPHRLASSPTPQLPLALWPSLAGKGLAVPPAGDDSPELEFKIDIDLTAGMGKEAGLAPNGTTSPGWQLPLLPGLRVGISQIASKLQETPGLLGSRIPPVTWEPPDGNATESTWELPGDSSLIPEGALEPGPESSSPAASPGSGGAFVALPGCPPDRPEEECASPLPAPGAPGLSSLLVPGLPLPVPLQADWRRARAAWGPAWEAHVYGAGALFALQALLALLGLAALPCRCPPDGRLLAPLQLLLAGAGVARALPLLVLGEEVCGRPGPWPPLAARLLHELPLPCLTSALAVAWLLLLPRRPPAAWLAALLPAVHFAAAAGAVVAAQRLPQLAPFLLLAARGLFALLAAPLAAALLARASCCCRCPRRAKGATATAACPPRPAARWRRAAALPAALAGLLSAALHGYGLLHALGYGLRAPLLGPWAWWALQLAGRLGEAGVGLPLAAMGLLLPAAPSSSSCRCCAERVAAKAQQSLPRHCPWALAQAPDGKPPPGEEARGPAHYLPLGALRAPSLLDADPTADFRPPSPIDLRRSIDEALCSCEGLFLADAPTGPPSSAASTLSLRLAPAPSDDDGDSPLCRAASCVQLLPSVPTAPASPQPCAASSGSTDAASLALTPSPTRARSPPPPGRQYWARPPASLESLASLGGRPRGGGGGAEAALLQEEFLDVCRQIDALSLASDTIDL